ncbi:uncharacterized protein B0H64DRAFT_389082 [Chaetomium fimeti]|uniref:FAD-binding PCMH-type domain-containing protein n=1 Tax=Chaetomium fimeti TaxID=1854472 RepID=A0AAE0HN44_9PEZI|nr:hypothetical protein B0H64DRAFT_389082 [Chaetomium fimeti]
MLPFSLALFAIYAAAEFTPSVRSGHGNNGDLTCKAVPGTPEWPPQHSWAHLNETVAGRLLQPPPPGAICHPEHASYNATTCPALRAAWSTYEFHQADPISMDGNQWTNDSCLPQEGAPCSGAGYPVFVINATTAHHVQQGVKFAKKHNVRLVVKSSGHDFLGRSNAPNTLSIWTRNLRGVKVHDSFRPSCCKAGVNATAHAVTAGAGMQMWDLYSALDPLNLTIVGGGGKTVSLGGYLTGGGHSLLSSWYGLAADQVLEMELVTPNGEIVIANECKNKDLFWAMRGGGGSTFGIMTSVTMKTIPTPKLEYLTLTMLTQNISSPRPIYEAAAYVLSKFPSMSDQGLASYTFFFPPTRDPLGGTDTILGALVTGATLQNSSPEEMHRLWDPVIAHVNRTWPGVFSIAYQPKTYPSLLAWFRENYDTSQAGLNIYSGSRLLDKAALTGNITESAIAYGKFVNGTIGIAHLVSGKGVHNARPRGGGNAVLPAWRNSYVHLTTSTSVPPLDPAAAMTVRKQIKERVDALRKLAPNTGAYINEANFEEPNFQHEFWGSNYERLLRIKRTMDPEDVLWCTPCVGNERWEQVGDRLCRINGA